MTESAPAGPRAERRLLAILALDVVGYSRMMEADEAGTIARLKAARAEVVEPLVAEHRGRLMPFAGDGALVLLESVVDAVACAAAIQRAMARRNAGLGEAERVVLRIGASLGDVALVGGEVYGDGVNIAARLEQLCEPGGLLVSGTAYDHLHGRTDLALEPAGERQVKNIARPVRLYRLGAAGEAAVTPPSALPDRPSLAVLPFDNLSGDPEQAYFSDGLTEDLITDLSKISGLFVLARTTTFALKGKPADVRELSARLKVRHLLEGSVRKAGRRVRITAQLVDGVTGGHLWAERYDGDLTDIFALQDEITAKIVAALKVTLLPRDRQALASGSTRSIEAYELYLRARHLLRMDGSRRSQEKARSLFVAAAEVDDGFARAFAGIAECDCLLYANHGREVSPEAMLANSERALALDPSLADAYASRGQALVMAGHPAEAERDFATAVSLDPGLYQAHLFHARLCYVDGRLEEAIRLFARAADARPDEAHAVMLAAMCHRDLGAFDAMRADARLCLGRARAEIERHSDNATAVFQAAVSLALLGERADALATASRALALDPDDLLVQYNVACVISLLGEPDRAIDLLERVLPRASADRKAWLQRDNDLAPLRAQPRFVALLQRHGVDPSG